MLTGFIINPNGTATGVITEDHNAVTLVDISQEALDAFLLSSGDGITSYFEDLTKLVNENNITQ